ncbi:serine/threonine protein kinase [Actinomadura coerulea]|uniref:Serine/threonine protein kinase n=1 Tax=Actinomadura coerulea TaxID=46159 RepID=A0A7X0G2H8_9ACTN|nr:serine/threonine protein kinase [Actinomadura coerulea]
MAGNPDLARRLRGTGRFPTVFDAASASGLRDLSKSGRVRAPAAFLFAPDFEEDLPGAGVPFLADGLAASGHTVIVHGFYTERGDVFAPEVIATARPLTLAELLELLGAPRSEPAPGHAGGTFTWPSEDPPPELRVTAAPRSADSSSLLPGYGGLSIVHRGAGSVTYRAVHEESGTAVAVRVRLDGSETPAEELAALERASRGEHLVSMLESGRATSGQRYTASVFCPGGAVTPEPLPVADAVGTAVSTAWALQALHDEGLVHGDVRPGRIMRGEAGPLLTGPATARGLAAHAAPGVLEPVARERVDPGFAAPEALLGRPQTVQADVYGLGATLWSLLAGHAPFTGRERAPGEAAPRVQRDDVPEWLGNALERALASEPADRYPTARAFAEALEEGLRAVPQQDVPSENAQWSPWDKAPAPDPSPAAVPEPQAPFADEQVPIADQPVHFADQPVHFAGSQATVADQPVHFAEPQATLADQPVHFAEPQAPSPEPQESPANGQAPLSEWQAAFATQPAPDLNQQVQFGEPPAPFGEPQAPPAHQYAQPSYRHVPFEEPQAPLTEFADQPLHFAEPQGPFTQYAAPPTSRRPRIVLLALVGLVLAAVVFSAIALLTGSGSADRRSADPPPASPPASRDPAPQAPASPAPGSGSGSPTSTPTTVRPESKFSPSQVRIVDSRVSIEISWKDATGGKAAYYVVGGPAGRTPSTMANVPAGTAKAQILALNPSVEYCLTVVAVLDVDRVAYAKPVCTHRGKREG